MQKVILLLTTTALLGCGGSPADSPVGDRTSSKPKVETSGTTAIAGQDFSLEKETGECTLVASSGKRFALNMDAACEFHKTSDGIVQVLEGHHGPVFIVASSVKEEGSSDCLTRTAAVTISGGEVYVAPAMSATASCLGNETLDDINFLAPRFDGLAYPGDE